MERHVIATSQSYYTKEHGGYLRIPTSTKRDSFAAEDTLSCTESPELVVLS